MPESEKLSNPRFSQVLLKTIEALALLKKNRDLALQAIEPPVLQPPLFGKDDQFSQSLLALPDQNLKLE